MSNPENPTVLFVDDEPELTRSLSVAYRKKPWNIFTADSGEAALALMENVEPDVVVSDERMPGMQGSELLTLVKERFPNSVRIILTGEASIESAARAINSAAIQRFLLKPCPQSELALAIEELLEKRRDRLHVNQWRKSSRVRPNPLRAQELDNALSSLWMGFQPILHAADESTFGYEALARTDDLVIRHPEALFAAANDLERGIEVGHYVRELVAARIPDAPDDSMILVNVNPDNFEDDRLIEGDEPLADHASRVVLEITERESLKVNRTFRDRIQSLRALGYRIAVDDLGAGYAGLTTFALLTPDFVKLDMELIRNLHLSPTKRELVEMITQMCGNLGIRTIAEGVETVEERDAVVELGCDLLQGFLWAKAQREFCEVPLRDVA